MAYWVFGEINRSYCQLTWLWIIASDVESAILFNYIVQ